MFRIVIVMFRMYFLMLYVVFFILASSCLTCFFVSFEPFRDVFVDVLFFVCFVVWRVHVSFLFFRHEFCCFYLCGELVYGASLVFFC